jgi:hypothetical protein
LRQTHVRGSLERLCLRNKNKNKRTGGIAQVIELLSSIRKAVCSISSLQKSKFHYFIEISTGNSDRMYANRDIFVEGKTDDIGWGCQLLQQCPWERWGQCEQLA